MSGWGTRLDASGRRISWGGMVKRSRGDAPVAAAAPAPPSLCLTLTLRLLDPGRPHLCPCCALVPPLVMPLVGEAPVCLSCRPQICVRQGFWFQTSNLMVVTKVSLGQTDDDDAVNWDEMMSKVAMRVAGDDVVSVWVVWV